MKKYLGIIIFVLLAVAVALVLIFNNEKSDYRIVKLSGANTYSNWSFSGYNNVIGENEDGIAAMPLYEDELLILSFDDAEIYYRYSLKDGIDLKFEAEDFKIMLNGKLKVVEISDDAEVLDWLEAVRSEDVKDLASVHIADSLPDEFIPLLNRLADVKPGLGVSMGSNFPGIEYILKTFDPVWLCCPIASVSDISSVRELLENATNLELLLIDGEFLESVDLSGLEQLKQLIIMEYGNSGEAKPFKLPENLESLCFAGCGLDDLDFLRGLPKLESLALPLCELNDLDLGVSNLAGLSRLSLSGSSNTGFKSIGEMPQLKAIALPGDISQDDFKRFTNLNRQLEIFELNCAEITDIDPVKNLPGLKCLTVNESDIPYEDYYSLKGLKYLSLTYEPENDKASIDSLQSKLPDTLIVPSNGLCLGSGWLLTLLPLLIGIWLFLLFRNKKLARN